MGLKRLFVASELSRGGEVSVQSILFALTTCLLFRQLFRTPILPSYYTTGVCALHNLRRVLLLEVVEEMEGNPLPLQFCGG